MGRGVLTRKNLITHAHVRHNKIFTKPYRQVSRGESAAAVIAETLTRMESEYTQSQISEKPTEQMSFTQEDDQSMNKESATQRGTKATNKSIASSKLTL